MQPARRTVLLILAICLAPVAASYFAYHFLTDPATMNYGELITPAPSGPLGGTVPDGGPAGAAGWRGKWLYVVVDSASCEARCQRKLYATRQARTLQNEAQRRVARLLLLTDSGALPTPLRAAHPDLVVARVDPRTIAWLPAAAAADDHVFLIDPLGNAILRYPADPDIKGMKADLARLLKYSRIG